MHDQFDVSLEDSDLLVEVELTTNLIIAASETDEQLSAGRDRRDPRRRPEQRAGRPLLDPGPGWTTLARYPRGVK